jgi:hypothetical protein
MNRRLTPAAIFASITLCGIAAIADVNLETPTTLPIVTRAEWGSKPLPIPEDKRHVPRIITLHHAGSLWTAGSDPVAKVRAMQTWGQREKNWPDLPYHFMIAPDGKIIEARDIQFQPESNTKYDLNGVLNIELFGNFEEQRVSLDQLRSTVNLIVHLKRNVGLDLDIPAIRGHRDAAETACPGADFYRYIKQGLIRQWVEETLDGKTPDVRLLDALPGGPTTMISDTQAPKAAD